MDVTHLPRQPLGAEQSGQTRHPTVSNLTERAGQAAARFTVAEPRVPMPSDAGILSASFQQAAAETDWSELYPDEYLVDGGDRDLPVHYDAYNRRGLDTEDTLVEYSDHTGQRHVKPTNRIAIYSPRFGAVQTVSTSSTGVAVERPASTFDLTRETGVSNRVVPTYHQQQNGAGSVRVRSRASGLETERQGAALSQALAVAEHNKLLNLYQDFAFLWTGQIELTDEARLAYGIAAARNWTHSQFPVISATTESLQEIQSTFKPQELVGLEVKHKRKGQLRIVKLADKKVAKPGDLITFTLRFDNLGEHELNHIRIIDNLTPRLEFVEDSGESDRGGQITVLDNEEGSLVLRFELDGPLPGQTGGVITFQARVR